LESKGFFAVGLNKFMRLHKGGEAAVSAGELLRKLAANKVSPPIRQRRQKRVTFLSVTLEERRT